MLHLGEEKSVSVLSAKMYKRLLGSYNSRIGRKLNTMQEKNAILAVSNDFEWVS